MGLRVASLVGVALLVAAVVVLSGYRQAYQATNPAAVLAALGRVVRHRARPQPRQARALH